MFCGGSSVAALQERRLRVSKYVRTASRALMVPSRWRTRGREAHEADLILRDPLAAGDRAPTRACRSQDSGMASRQWIFIPDSIGGCGHSNGTGDARGGAAGSRFTARSRSDAEASRRPGDPCPPRGQVRSSATGWACRREQGSAGVLRPPSGKKRGRRFAAADVARWTLLDPTNAAIGELLIAGSREVRGGRRRTTQSRRVPARAPIAISLRSRSDRPPGSGSSGGSAFAAN